MKDLDLTTMKKGAKKLVGTKDFQLLELLVVEQKVQLKL